MQLLAALHARIVGGGRGIRRRSRAGPLLLRRRREVGPKTLHGLLDAAAHLVRDETDGVGEARLDALEFSGSRLDLGVAGRGDLVDRLAAVDGLGDQTLFFE